MNEKKERQKNLGPPKLVEKQGRHTGRVVIGRFQACLAEIKGAQLDHQAKERRSACETDQPADKFVTFYYC
jgi:hypothetical protein